MPEGQLLAITIAPTAKVAMEGRQEAEAIPGKGLSGDRYAAGKGAFQKGDEIAPRQEVSLIESEAIEAVVRDYELDITHSDTRRNLLTRGVALNHLVGQAFAVGEVVFKGVKLCEPCGYLEGLTCEGIEEALKHRGGLRAQVIQGGTIRVNDAIRVVDV
jgi:MOSC domain-containing protein YiiM